jgi:hypothetical protein
MRNLAVIICDVVATPDSSRPVYNFNDVHNINMTIFKARGGSGCHVVAIGRVDRMLATPRC